VVNKRHRGGRSSEVPPKVVLKSSSSHSLEESMATMCSPPSCRRFSIATSTSKVSLVFGRLPNFLFRKALSLRWMLWSSVRLAWTWWMWRCRWRWRWKWRWRCRWRLMCRWRWRCMWRCRCRAYLVPQVRLISVQVLVFKSDFF